MSWLSQVRRSLNPAALYISLALFSLNAYIGRELFTAGFLSNLSSNEGAFVSIARFYHDHPAVLWGGERWFPWFNTGMPIGNAYQPLLPAATALAAWFSQWPIEQAFHFVLALAWCAGPVTLFWFVFDFSESPIAGAVAGLAWSLLSPAQWFIPTLRGPASLRLFNLVHYAEDPHVVALTLVPLALLFLRRRSLIPAVIASSAVVLTNAFGAIDLAVGGLCIVLALRRGWTVLVLTGTLGWLWISPWLTPSLIRQISHDQWGARGVFTASPVAWLALAAFPVLWFVTRRIGSPFERFTLLFVPLICAIPVCFFALNLTLVPQASRYQLELEMGIAIAIGCLAARIPQRASVLGPLAIAILIAGIPQIKAERRFARDLLQPIDITQTIQYKTDRWLATHLPGQRAMIGGDTEFLYNVISDNSQMSGGHEPTVPNLVERFAIFAIYTGSNAGDRDAEYSLIWLKAFGNQAVTVPGEKSREAYHPFAHPHKFDGLLPVLWHDEDDTIFGVPQRSASLAHVIPREGIVAREPIHGLDVNPVRPYVAALDNPALPLATLSWTDPSHATVRATLNLSQLISVQESYAPGWRAVIQGREIPVSKDGLGLILIDPQCTGPCEIELSFGPSPETRLCRAFSLLATAFLLWRAYRRRVYDRSNK